MSMPLKYLINYTGNIYEMVSAVIQRSQQITEIRAAYTPTTLEEQQEITTSSNSKERKFGNEKATSIAFREVFNEEVLYKKNR